MANFFWLHRNGRRDERANGLLDARLLERRQDAQVTDIRNERDPLQTL